MALSGVKVDPQCITLFEELKMSHSLKYIVYGFSEDKSRIVVERTGDNSSTYNDFIETLPANECRYAVYNFDFDYSFIGTGVTAKRERIVFLVWCPDTSKIREKMLFASSNNLLRKALDGVQVDVQGTDLSEIDFDSVLEKATRNLR